MLHSTLPRAFLAPGLNYLSYYGDEIHRQYGPATTWHIPTEDSPGSYPRLSECHALQTWDSSRSSTPCPLDLSLKAPATPSTPNTPNTPNTPKTEEDTIEVEDGKERRFREEAHGRYDTARCRIEGESGTPLLLHDESESLPRSASVQSHPSYEQPIFSNKEPTLCLQEAIGKARLPEDTTRLPAYPTNITTNITTDVTHKYHPPNPTLLLTSPSHLSSAQSYHQQLLLTPQHHLQGMHAPMTPPSTPSPPQCPRRRTVREEDGSRSTNGDYGICATTPKQSTQAAGTGAEKPLQKPKKKHARRLKFDEDTSSPVSGTVILGPDEAVVTGDIDPAFNIVEVTEEARAELAKIENRLGPYQCKLCRQLHEDAFQLAQHRCSRIAHVEYRCPECDKRFSCPANLASHRRWHKPRLSSAENASSSGSSAEIPCTRCEAKFTRQAALRKHLASQHPETNNNVVAESPETIGKQELLQIPADASPNAEMP